MKSDIRIYKSCKELPFLNYKKIMQNGDFLYMVKGYEEGDEIEVDKKELEIKFNELINDFAISINASNDEVVSHSNYVVSFLEYNKLVSIINILSVLNEANKKLLELGEKEPEEIQEIIKELLEDIKIKKTSNLDDQIRIIKEKISVHENNIAKYNKKLQSEKNTDEESEDIDRQFINVCLGLEIPFPDESKITLYQYSIMIDRVIEKSKMLEKINAK